MGDFGWLILRLGCGRANVSGCLSLFVQCVGSEPWWTKTFSLFLTLTLFGKRFFLCVRAQSPQVFFGNGKIGGSVLVKIFDTLFLLPRKTPGKRAFQHDSFEPWS